VGTATWPLTEVPSRHPDLHLSSRGPGFRHNSGTSPPDFDLCNAAAGGQARSSEPILSKTCWHPYGLVAPRPWALRIVPDTSGRAVWAVPDGPHALGGEGVCHGREVIALVRQLSAPQPAPARDSAVRGGASLDDERQRRFAALRPFAQIDVAAERERCCRNARAPARLVDGISQ